MYSLCSRDVNSKLELAALLTSMLVGNFVTTLLRGLCQDSIPPDRDFTENIRQSHKLAPGPQINKNKTT